MRCLSFDRPVSKVGLLSLRAHPGVDLSTDAFMRELDAHVAPVSKLEGDASVQLDLDGAVRGWHVRAEVVSPFPHDVALLVG